MTCGITLAGGTPATPRLPVGTTRGRSQASAKRAQGMQGGSDGSPFLYIGFEQEQFALPFGQYSFGLSDSSGHLPLVGLKECRHIDVAPDIPKAATCTRAANVGKLRNPTRTAVCWSVDSHSPHLVLKEVAANSVTSRSRKRASLDAKVSFDLARDGRI